MMKGLLEGWGGARNASTRVAGKVGWPVNWCPMLIYPPVHSVILRFIISFSITARAITADPITFSSIITRVIIPRC
jgi:hypothetical protein